MGGDLTYECVAPNQYRVELNFFRDCNGVAAPSNCNNGRRFRVRSQECNVNLQPCFSLVSVDIVTPICLAAPDRCLNPSAQYGVERYRYATTVNLGNWANCGTDWIFEWELCCRNNAITSLVNPGGQNLYLSATLNTNPSVCNNSPKFLNDPTPFGCVGQPISYNHGFQDADGDSLVFSLAPARGTNGSILAYSPGYTFLQPVVTAGGGDAVQIDPQTGTISFVPSIQQFSVVTVRVDEYRDGVLIGSYLRDVQFAIIACNNSNPTATGINGSNQFTLNICAGENVCFDVLSTDPDLAQAVTMTWNAAIPGATFNVTNVSPPQRPTGTFCWTPGVANIGSNFFTVTVEDDACVLSGNNTYGFLINVTPPFTPADAGPDQVVCGSSATLDASQPYNQILGTWSVVSGAGTFTNPNSPTSQVTGLGTGTNVFQWTQNYLTCGTTSDQVTIVSHDPGQAPADAGPDQELCLPTTTTTMAGNVAVAPATGTWTLVSGSGTIAQPNSPITEITGLAPGNNVFRWTINNGPCGAPTNDLVSIFVFSNTQPAANAGPDQQACGPVASVTLTGNTPIVPATGQWSLVSGSGTITSPSTASTTVTGLPVGTHVFAWTLSNGPCQPPTTTDQVTVTVFDPNSPVAEAGPDQAACTPATVSLSGSVPIAPSSGVWSLVSGSGTITSPNSPATTVTGLGVGVNVFAWTVNNGACPSGVTSDQVSITVFDGTLSLADGGPDQFLCSNNATATMAASAIGFPATGQWSLVSGSGTITSLTSPTTTITGLGVGENVFEWAVDNGPCPGSPSADPVSIFVYDENQPAANAGPDQDLCLPINSTTMAANPAIFPAVGTWTVVSGSGSFADPNSPTTTVSNIGAGINVYRWTIDNGPCANPITQSQVTIRLFDPNTPTPDAGPDQELCSTSPSTTLTGSAIIAPATGQWTLVSGAGTINSPNSPTTTVSGLAVGQNVFRWSVSNGPCGGGASFDEVSILVFPANQAAADAGTDQSICVPVEPSNVFLAANAVTFPATGTWTIVQGGGTFADASDPNTQVTGIPVGQNIYQWTINNGPCPSGNSSDQVSVFVFDAANAVANAGPDQSLCSSTNSNTMAGSALIAPATGQWTLISGVGTITNPASPTTTVTGLGVGQNIFQWTVSNGTCANPITLDQVSIFVYDQNNPPADAGPDQEFCSPPFSTTLVGSAVTFPATGTWTLVSGTGSIVDPASATTQVTGLSDLEPNVFAWTVNNGPCPGGITSDVVTIVLFPGDAQEADAGPDQELCSDNNSTVLAANEPVGLATGQWSVVQGSATFANAASANTAVSGLGVGLNILRWSIDNGACGLTTDQVNILVFPANQPAANAGADQELCTPNTSTTLAGNAPVFPATGLWTLVSGSGIINNPTSPTSSVSALGIGANVFRWTITNGPCDDPITFDDVTIFLYQQDAPAANAGPDQDICSPQSSVTLAGNAPVGSAIGTWTLQSGQGNIASPNQPTTDVTDLPVGTHVLVWTIDNGPCGTTSDQMVIRVFDENNAVADAGPDQQLCTPDDATNLAGSVVIAPAVGTWTLVSGTATIASPNDPNTAVSGMPVGAHVFRWTVDNGPCANGTSFDEVTVLVFEESDPVADAGPDQEICTPQSTVTLSGSAVTFPATGTWTLVSGSGTITNASDPNTSVTGLPVGTHVFEWTVSNGPCANGSTSDQVTIRVFDENNEVANAGPDQEICTPTDFTVMAGSPVTSPAVGTWTLVSGGGTIVSPNDPNSAITGLPVGENVFRWTVLNGPCANPLTTDQVSIFVFDENNPVADAGPDQELCTPQISTTLSGSAPIFPASGQWTLVSGQGTIVSPNSATTNITGLGIGVNVFEWTMSNGPCTQGITTDQVTVTVFSSSNAVANAGPDQELCSDIPSTVMAGSVVTAPAAGTWTLVSGGGTIVSPNDPNTAISGLPVGENIFQWTVDNGPCAEGITIDQVSIFVFDENNADANAGPDQEVCTPQESVLMAGSPVIFPATGTWTLVSGSGIIVDPSNPNTQIDGLPVGEHVFEWTVDNGPCSNGSTTDQVRIRVYEAENQEASAGPDQEICTPQSTVQLAGSPVIFPAVGTWTVVSGTANITDPNDPNTTVTGLQVGVCVLEWTVDNGPCETGITSSQMTISVFDENNPDADAGPDQELCTPNSATNMAGSAVTFPAVGTWTLVSGTGQISDPNDPNTAITGLEVGEHVFEWTVSNGPCDNGLTSDTMTILVFDENNAEANAGPDQQVCTPVTSATLAGSPVIFPANGTWSLVSGSGDIEDPNDPNTTVTNLGIGDNVFAWTVDNGPCAVGVTSDEVTIQLFDLNAPPAAAGPDQQLCAPDLATTLEGNTPVGAAIGQWTVTQGPGTIAFADASDPGTSVSGLAVGENILTWTIDNGICGVTSDNVSIFVFDPDNLDAFAGLDQELCVPQDSAFMAGSAVIFPAIGVWTVLSGSGSFVDPNDPLTLVEGLSIGVNILQWTVDNGPCSNGITSDLVSIVLYDDSTSAANAGPDQELCLPLTSTTLEAEQPIAPGVGTWSVIAGGALVNDPGDPNSSVTGLTVGVNTFVWSLEWFPCPNNGVLTDTVHVLLFDPGAPVADAGPDQEFCTPVSSTFLEANTPAPPGTGTWTVESGDGIFADPNDPNSEVTGLGVGEHIFRWTIYNGECGFGPSSFDLVSIFIFDEDAPDADAGEDIEVCTPVTSVALAGNQPVAPAVGTWTVVNGQATLSDPNDPQATLSGLEPGQYDLVWSIYNGPCGTSEDQVTVVVYDDQAIPAVAGPDQELCTPQTSTVLQGNAPVLPATGFWNVVSGTGDFADATDPGTTVSGLSIGTNVFQWNHENGPCGTTSDVVTIIVYDASQEAANAGPDQQICTPASSVQLQANTVTPPATGTWVFVSGTGNISDPNDPNATLSGLGVGQVVLQWVVDNGPCEAGITIDEVTISVFDGSAPPAAAGPDQSFCTPIDEPVTMFASSATPPATGTWTLVSGAGQIAEPGNPFTAITGLGLGNNVFLWTVDNGVCGVTSDEVSLIVFDHTVPPADAGPGQEYCEDQTSTELQAAPATSTATGFWSSLGQGITISEPGNPFTSVSGLQPGENWFVWTVDNGDCGTTSDTMLVFLRDCLTLVIPDAFSPNSDGVNDTFVIVNIDSYPGNQFQVFNRWGNKVLDRRDYRNDWDGRSEFGSAFGEQLPESTYYYILDLGNGAEPFTGFIYLRR